MDAFSLNEGLLKNFILCGLGYMFFTYICKKNYALVANRLQVMNRED
jgi:hypothetical protein